MNLVLPIFRLEIRSN